MWEIKGRERRERKTRRGQREESEREYGTGREEMNCKARSEEGWEATKGAFHYSQC